MAAKHRSSRHGEAKGRVIGHVHRSPGTFVWVTGGGTVREMHPPRRHSRALYGDKKARKGSRKGSRKHR